MPIKKAHIKFPCELKTKRVWIGSYGGHFNIVVVFTEKPKKCEEENCYHSFQNKNILAGIFDASTFNDWFGTNISPTDTDIRSLEQYDLTACWDEFEQIVGLDTNAD